MENEKATKATVFSNKVLYVLLDDKEDPPQCIKAYGVKTKVDEDNVKIKVPFIVTYYPGEDEE